MKEEKIRSALIYLIGAILCYASIPILLKYFTVLLDVWTVNAVRYTTAALIWLPFVIKHSQEQFTGRNIWRDALIPSVANICGQNFWALAPYYNNAGIIGFVVQSSFLFTAIFGFVFLPEERLLARSRLFWGGSIVCVTAVLIMYMSSITGEGTNPQGLAIILSAGLCWGLYGVSVRRYMHGYPARYSFGVISIYTASTLFVLMIFKGDWSQLKTLDIENWSLLLLSAVFGIASSHVLLYKAIHLLGPIVAQGGTLLTPFLTAIGALVILGEVMSSMQWFGGLVLIGGSLLLVLAKRKVGEHNSL